MEHHSKSLPYLSIQKFQECPDPFKNASYFDKYVLI